MDSGLLPKQSFWHRDHFGFAVNFPTRYARFGVFDLDLQKQELFKNGSRVKLQGKVSQALLTLLENHGEVVTREALRMRLWPVDEHVNFDANVNTTVNKLRLVLGDSSEQPLYVETIPRKGYSLVARVEFLDRLPVRQPEPTAQAAPASASSSIGTELKADARELKASFLRVVKPSTWLTAGVIALVVAGFLLGAALMLYAHRAV
jgi:DNA-binding winged helix-turn-helix (wHTH) protein